MLGPYYLPPVGHAERTLTGLFISGRGKHALARSNSLERVHNLFDCDCPRVYEENKVTFKKLVIEIGLDKCRDCHPWHVIQNGRPYCIKAHKFIDKEPFPDWCPLEDWEVE